MGKAKILALAMVISVAAPPATGQSFLKKLEGATGGLGKQLGIAGKGSASSLSNAEIGKGIKEALRVGKKRLVGQLGPANGFNSDPQVHHIPLPNSLKRVQSALGRVGLSGMADDLELKLNRAAEAATPKAKKFFWNSLSGMNLDDVQKIWKGPKNAATQFFQGKMTTPLKGEFRPIVNASLADVGAVASYEKMMGQYKSLPFVPDVKADLVNHVLDKAIAGIFIYLGREEAAIRDNPAKQTTAILKKVFGG
jgi:hypothetical protein